MKAPSTSQRSRVGRLGSDRDQAGQRAVQHHGQVSLAKYDLGDDQRGDQAASRCRVGVEKHVGDFVGDPDAAQFQG